MPVSYSMMKSKDVTTKIISCYASAIPLRAPVSKTHTVVVKYPPESPSILGYEELSALKQGDLQRLICVVLGGNPPANLKWYRGDREISAPVSISGSGVSSELVFRVDASDNGISYTCKAFSPAISQPLETSVTLTVYFPSEKVLLSVDPQIPKEGQTVTLVCQTGSGNPKPVITLLRNNKIEEEYYEEIHNASHGGLAVKSRIVFVARPSDDGARFICRTKSDVFPDTVEAQIILRILYKPKFSSIVQKRDLMEGDSIEINLTAVGNPDVISYKWYKEGAPVPVESSEDKSTKNSKEIRLRVTSLGPVLYIKSASRYDSSIYTCEASNEEGSSNATVILNVRYPAVIINISASIEVKEGDNVKLECNFDGNPLPEDTISWKKDGIRFTKYSIEGKKSYLIRENITRTEAGEYYCIANNGMGKESIKSTIISVLHRPVIRRSQMKSKVASDIKDTAKFRCIADSYSNTSINWSYKKQLLERSPKYEVRNSARNSTWECTLLVKQLEESDFGIYECIATNSLGKDIFQFLLVKRGPPEPPVDLQVVNVSNNYIFIIWKPGFDGGYVSSFRIRYRQLGIETYYFQDAVAMRHNHKIVDLKAGTEYYIAVSAWNDLGHSNFTSEIKASTTEIAVMDSTQASPGKKIKSTTGNSKWWWICVTAVGTVFVLVNVIVVICLIHKGKCCARSIGGQSCVHDIDKQVRYTIEGKSFYITGEKLDVAHEHIMMENIKNKDQKTYLTVDIVGKRLNLQPSNLRRKNKSDTFSEKFEELVHKTSSSEFPDILKRINYDASAFKDEKISDENDQSPFRKSKNCLSSSTRSLNSDASSLTEPNISLPMTSTSSCDLRIRHILFEPEQPPLKPFIEYLDS
ncbi:synaptogenesis protein syg-2-like [Centruroides sculpturatus]|uniref:synaptogenesis protein syg-2-like n=1 Tax=Centruroides sculpturatus TaxID=218467 RepID=UPI000C6E456C|nr:synaptogenesis protein syg-2-like [Centruroides sculpturatus]